MLCHRLRVYKQNIEISSKNKTLSLLSRLYEISVLTLNSVELAKRISQIIQSELNFEFVGILSFDSNANKIEPLAFSVSERVRDTASKNNFNFDSHPIHSDLFVKKFLSNREIVNELQLSDIWDEVSEKFISDLVIEAHIKSCIALPLRVEKGTAGVLIVGLNRHYSDLIGHEKESIGSFINVIAVALDKAWLYEKLRVTNEQLEVSNDRLTELDRQKTEFVSFASHQLRSPLTSIKGYASLILEGDYGEITDDLKKAAQIIFDSSKTLATVVDDYLNVSRIELGQMKYEFAQIDLKALVQTVIDEQKPNVEKAGLKLNFNAESGSYAVNADKEKLKQVISNIIDNSVKYTPMGEITVGVKNVKNNVQVSVTDTGIGIPKDVIPKLFAKFSRAKDANKTNIRGTGLGLFIAKEIVTAHEGKIWVESDGEGKGSQFYIEIAQAKE